MAIKIIPLDKKGIIPDTVRKVIIAHYVLAQRDLFPLVLKFIYFFGNRIELRSGERSDVFLEERSYDVHKGVHWLMPVQEIEFMKECDHPNIIRYYGTHVKKDKLWVRFAFCFALFCFFAFELCILRRVQIVMEFCGGGSVSDLVEVMEAPLNEEQIAYICKETLRVSYLNALDVFVEF